MAKIFGVSSKFSDDQEEDQNLKIEQENEQINDDKEVQIQDGQIQFKENLMELMQQQNDFRQNLDNLEKDQSNNLDGLKTKMNDSKSYFLHPFFNENSAFYHDEKMSKIKKIDVFPNDFEYNESDLAILNQFNFLNNNDKKSQEITKSIIEKLNLTKKNQKSHK